MSLYNEKLSTYFSTARREIVDLAPRFSQRVLEIGCGTGRTLELLKSEKRCEETVGVEAFVAAATEGQGRVDAMYCLDVEKEPLPERIGTFDLILMLDVLEHLVDPWALLDKLIKQHLSPGGKVIISLPNARHFSLVFPLMFCGRFTYVERGLRDKTHLRFFTKHSSKELLLAANLRIESVIATSLDLHLNSGKLNALTLGIFSEFLASQYIFRASVR